MKKIIIERLKALQKEKQEQNRVPADPNELELKNDIHDVLVKELESLINDGSIEVVGSAINKRRILRAK